jgi:hypothetical protein
MTFKCKFLCAALLSAALVACGGGGSGSDIAATSTPLTGVLVDSPVGGLDYATATRKGKTNTKGEFQYLQGETVTFSIGNIQLPSVLANSTITPLNMANTSDINHQIVSNILVLLQSLDEDGDPSNGITIPITAASHATSTVSFDVTPAAFATHTGILSLIRTLLNASTSADSVKTQVLSLSATYGELDGANNYYYATKFAQVYQSLSTDQKTKLTALRKSMMSGTYADGTTFDFTIATTPFLYSTVLTDTQIAPHITDAATSPLFFEP